MADVKDITAVIASALDEISMTGSLDVVMGDAEIVQAVGQPTGDDVEVVVIVRHAGDATAPIEPQADR